MPAGRIVARALNLKPGIASGAVCRVGPIMLADLAAESVVVRFSGETAGLSTAVMTLQTRRGDTLETIDAAVASATTVTVNGAAARIHDPSAIDELWLSLTTEEASAATGMVEVSIRAAQDDLAGRGIDRQPSTSPGSSGTAGVIGGGAGGGGGGSNVPISGGGGGGGVESGS